MQLQLKRDTKVRVTLKKACADCNTDISVTVATLQSRRFPETSHAATYRSGVCNNCSWERANKHGHNAQALMDSVLQGLTPAQYQQKHGVAWNE